MIRTGTNQYDATQMFNEFFFWEHWFLPITKSMLAILRDCKK